MKDEKPLVSVIIPVYNSEKYIRETLDSILASDYKNIEIIIVDDGSSDDSLSIIKEYEIKYNNIRCFTQANKGVSAARNKAIENANGTYILPVDSDDLISKDFISEAVSVLINSQTTKVVSPTAMFFGNKSGQWKLPPFSLNLLAHRNILSCCALYRKSDWERVGGYEENVAREDWVFWISVLKDGGEVVCLPKIGHYYRIHKNSKRIKDRSQKKQTIDKINDLYPEFFLRELNGPLRYKRGISKFINTINNIINKRTVFINPQYKETTNLMLRLRERFDKEGKTIYKGRNELKEFNIGAHSFIIKSYKRPNLINQIAYGIFRQSKAERAYLYAEELLKIGVGSPTPVGFFTERKWFLFNKSYFVSLKSECPYTYNDLNNCNLSLSKNSILKAIGKVTAILHNNNFLHKDYSGGNILFDEKGERIEIIDLNRMYKGKIDIENGCKNFERLSATPEMLEIMGREYAINRGFDEIKCLELIKHYNKQTLI
jgi:Glycosyltransferases, probably involved in cell wall biogenesis